MGVRVLHVFTVPDSLLFLRGQVSFMRARGYDLEVATAPGIALDAFGLRERVPVHRVRMARKITPAQDTRSLGELVTLCRELRPDIVHSHTPKGGLLGTTAAALARVPTRIYHMRGLPLATATGVQRLLLSTTERTSCALATRVLSVSRSLRDEAVSRSLVPRSKIRVLGSGSGNGVDAEGRFNPDTVDPERVRAFRAQLGVGDAPLIGFVGRLVRDKGIVDMVRAWEHVRERVPGVYLVIAGVFEERDAVPLALRRRLESDPRVRMSGFVEDTATLYAALDVLAFPSHREGFPNVPLEAASMRVPVVGASAVGTVDAIVDGVSGTVVPIGDGDALAQALARYLLDSELARQHGAAARRRVLEEFTSERVWRELADFYDAELARDRLVHSAM